MIVLLRYIMRIHINVTDTDQNVTDYQRLLQINDEPYSTRRFGDPRRKTHKTRKGELGKNNQQRVLVKYLYLRSGSPRRRALNSSYTLSC